VSFDVSFLLQGRVFTGLTYDTDAQNSA
jgi:hypothetical protein